MVDWKLTSNGLPLFKTANVNSVTNPRGHTSTAIYDAERCLKEVQAPAPFNYLTKNTWDENSNLTKVERQTGDVMNPWQIVQYAFSNTDKLSTVTDPANNQTTVQYDGADRLWKIRDFSLEGVLWNQIRHELGPALYRQLFGDFSRPVAVAWEVFEIAPLAKWSPFLREGWADVGIDMYAADRGFDLADQHQGEGWSRSLVEDVINDAVSQTAKWQHTILNPKWLAGLK